MKRGIGATLAGASELVCSKRRRRSSLPCSRVSPRSWEAARMGLPSSMRVLALPLVLPLAFACNGAGKADDIPDAFTNSEQGDGDGDGDDTGDNSGDGDGDGDGAVITPVTA